MTGLVWIAAHQGLANHLPITCEKGNTCARKATPTGCHLEHKTCAQNLCSREVLAEPATEASTGLLMGRV